MKTRRLSLCCFGLFAALVLPGLYAQAPAAPEGEASEPVERSASAVSHRNRGLVFRLGGDAYLPAGERAENVVVIFGTARVDGDVSGSVVTVWGPAFVKGKTGEAVVSVFGKARVENDVGEDVVSVLGGVDLGERAHVRGSVVSVGPPVNKHAAAIVDEDISDVGVGIDFWDADDARSWFSEAFLLGRPLAWTARLDWAWVIAGIFLTGYLLIALLFNRGVVRCAETLEQFPGRTLGATFLLLLLVPLVTVLLAITVIGPVVWVAVLVLLGLFGKAAFLAWLGRRITLPLGLTHAAPAVLAGAALLTLGYLVPVLGFVLLFSTSALGLGMAFSTGLLYLKQERATAARAEKTKSAGVAAATTAAASVETEPRVQRFSRAEAPPPVSPLLVPAPAAAPMDGVGQSVLRRAGFRIRLVAAAVDALLIWIVAGFVSAGGLFVPALAVYSVIMWVKKGTTIGGVVCGLKLVRLDDQPVDWTIATVRALAGFLSFFPAGLGFLWVAFDDERQSWHDKIAGTVIVHAPKGASLI